MSYANGRLPDSVLAPIPGGRKTCSTCKQEKPLEDFSRDNSHKDGRTSDCKICNRVRQRETRQRGPLPFVSLAQRLERRHLVAESGCWEWQGKKRRDGYGSIKINGKQRVVHRVAYELFVEEVKSNLVLDHKCRNRLCFNPDHLQQCTRGENVMAPGSESPSAINARKTHCSNGHLFDESNTHITKLGKRHCRACDAAKQRAKRALKKEEVMPNV